MDTLDPELRVLVCRWLSDVSLLSLAATSKSWYQSRYNRQLITLEGTRL